MPDKYERLLEQNIRAIETSNRVADALLEVAKSSRDITSKMNDNFILHDKELVETKVQGISTGQDVSEIRKVLMKWVKTLAILLFVTVGGLSVLKMLGIDLTSLFN